MKKLPIFIIVLVIAGIAALFLLPKGVQTPLVPQQESSLPKANEEIIVKYTDSGFNPSQVTISINQTVTFINESSNQMWVASAFHPTHQELPGFDQLKETGNGGTYQYTFTKVGEWKYHNHLNPKHFGAVIAE